MQGSTIRVKVTEDVQQYTLPEKTNLELQYAQQLNAPFPAQLKDHDGLQSVIDQLIRVQYEIDGNVVNADLVLKETDVLLATPRGVSSSVDVTEYHNQYGSAFDIAQTWKNEYEQLTTDHRRKELDLGRQQTRKTTLEDRLQTAKNNQKPQIRGELGEVSISIEQTQQQVTGLAQQIIDLEQDLSPRINRALSNPTLHTEPLQLEPRVHSVSLEYMVEESAPPPRPKAFSKVRDYAISLMPILSVSVILGGIGLYVLPLLQSPQTPIQQATPIKQDLSYPQLRWYRDAPEPLRILGNLRPTKGAPVVPSSVARSSYIKGILSFAPELREHYKVMQNSEEFREVLIQLQNAQTLPDLRSVISQRFPHIGKDIELVPNQKGFGIEYHTHFDNGTKVIHLPPDFIGRPIEQYRVLVGLDVMLHYASTLHQESWHSWTDRRSSNFNPHALKALEGMTRVAGYGVMALLHDSLAVGTRYHSFLKDGRNWEQKLQEITASLPEVDAVKQRGLAGIQALYYASSPEAAHIQQQLDITFSPLPGQQSLDSFNQSTPLTFSVLGQWVQIHGDGNPDTKNMDRRGVHPNANQYLDQLVQRYPGVRTPASLIYAQRGQFDTVADQLHTTDGDRIHQVMSSGVFPHVSKKYRLKDNIDWSQVPDCGQERDREGALYDLRLNPEFLGTDQGADPEFYGMFGNLSGLDKFVYLMSAESTLHAMNTGTIFAGKSELCDMNLVEQAHQYSSLVVARLLLYDRGIAVDRKLDYGTMSGILTQQLQAIEVLDIRSTSLRQFRDQTAGSIRYLLNPKL